MPFRRWQPTRMHSMRMYLERAMKHERSIFADRARLAFAGYLGVRSAVLIDSVCQHWGGLSSNCPPTAYPITSLPAPIHITPPCDP